MRTRDIKLGERYWVILKLRAIDEKSTDPDFLVHLMYAKVTAKGVYDNCGTSEPFVDVADQRLKPDNFFVKRDSAIAYMQKTIDNAVKVAQAPKTVPPDA